MKKNKKNIIIASSILIVGGGAYLYSQGYFNSLGKDPEIYKIAEELGKNTYQFISQLTINEANYYSVMTTLINREILLKYNTSVHNSYIQNNVKKIIVADARLSYYAFDKINKNQKDYEKYIGAFLYPLVEELVKTDKIIFTRK